ncbi:SpvB domain-containing protein [Aspergillus udagawae]|uniref:SpvB domain-containing protein, partial n=1 Tax=Aspergillus udagawae TaxID=91492 RepID=A0A8H3SGV3_9EURO|nr:SpvB domain-containing protein [Aspergillus udagawae]
MHFASGNVTPFFTILSKDRNVVSNRWGKTKFRPWSRCIFDPGDTVALEDPATDPDVGSSFQLLGRDTYYPRWQALKIASTGTGGLEVSQSMVYNDTPQTVHLDPLGRGILTQVDNSRDPPQPPSPSLSSAHGRIRDIRDTRTGYDVFRNISTLHDTRNRLVQITRYDLLGRALHTVSMDSGHRWALATCTGEPNLSWSSGGPRKRTVYDSLRRVAEVRLLGEPGGVEQIEVQNVYGESLGDEAAKDNLNGQLYQCRDQSGRRVHSRFDFKGHCLESLVQYATEYTQRLDWSRPVQLEESVYTTRTSFNALGHPVRSVAVDGARTTCTIVRRYDVAGRLQSIQSSDPGGTQASVSRIEYAADDQITRIEYPNGVCTTNDYQPETRRLARTVDHAQQEIFFADAVVQPVQRFGYDAVGQLIRAIGREQVDGSNKHLAAPDGRSRTTQGRGNGRQMIEYEEMYQYDVAGNIEAIRHRPLTAGRHATAGVGDDSVGRTPLLTVESTRTHGAEGEAQYLLRYQMGDLLELDDTGQVISYEEFSPYGTSTYQLLTPSAPRKYRFAGYQRDSESGLDLCGKRYYASWLGRWTSADPLGPADGLNLYAYAENDPVNFDDHQGTNKTKKSNKGQKRNSGNTDGSSQGAEGGATGGGASNGRLTSQTALSIEQKAAMLCLIGQWIHPKLQSKENNKNEVTLKVREYPEFVHLLNGAGSRMKKDGDATRAVKVAGPWLERFGIDPRKLSDKDLVKPDDDSGMYRIDRQSTTDERENGVKYANIQESGTSPIST